MNQRITAMIHLLNDSKTPLRIADLAERFRVSQRTVRNDLNEINALLKQNHLPKLALESGGRIVCPDTFDQVLPSILTGDFYTYKLSKEERKRVAAAMLVNAPGYITLAEIAENLFVSRATIIHDLDEIKAFVQENGLEVLSYANKGLRVTGPESKKRFFLLRLLQGELEEKREIVAMHISVQAGNRVIIQKILSEQEHIYKSFLTDTSFQAILLYLGILVNRNRQGEFMEPQPPIDGDKYCMAQDILRYVVQYCGVKTTEDDIRALCLLLNQARYMRHSSFEKDAVKIQMLTRQFIAGISEELEINLNNDYDFFENLSNHLESVFSAPPAAYPERAVIDEVLEDHQEVVESVRNRLPMLQHYIGREIIDMEIAYIAIHICAAIERLRPVVYEAVPDDAPALMKKLRRVVRDYFNQSLEAEAEIFSPYLHHLLPQSNIELDVECSDWRDAVRRSAVRLVERGYIENRYIDAMIENIEENGPYIVLSKGFAVPHEGLEQGSIRVGMYLIRLKTPVAFGAEDLDPVEFVCCLSAVDHRTHLKAFFNLVNMLRDEEFKNLLHLCRTSEEAASIIEKYEYSILG